MAGYYLQEAGGYIILENGSGYLSLEGVGAAEVPAGSPGAGGRKRFQNYIVRLDGKEFNCKSLDQVYNVLEQAKALARKLSQERVREATKPQASVKPLPVPEITGNSRDTKAAIRETEREIRQIYKAANMDIEIALWFAVEREKEQAQEDDEIAVLFLM